MADQFVQIDKKQYKRLQSTLKAYPKGVARVMYRATNKIATKSRQEMSVEIRKRLNVKAGELKRRNLTLSRAKLRSPSALIQVKGGRIPLSKLGARQTMRGVSYKIGKTGPRKLATRAFIATMSTGH